jgi:hypothetical protein
MTDSGIPADANSNGSTAVIAGGETRGVQHSEQGVVPSLFHRVRHTNSILALAVSKQYIYAGTQGGEILVGLPLGHFSVWWNLRAEFICIGLVVGDV